MKLETGAVYFAVICAPQGREVLVIKNKEELEVCIVIVTKPYVSRVLYFFVNGYDSREMSNSINNGFV